jgi:hypothetical protein
MPVLARKAAASRRTPKSAHFVIPAIFRESIPHAMEVRQETAGMTDRGGRLMGIR